MKKEQKINREEGFDRIAKIVENSPIAMMATQLLKIPFAICPMKTVKVDKKGVLWFFSDSESEHYNHISEDSRVQLLYSNEKEGEYISVYGKAVFNVDRSLMDKLWEPECEKWFDGKDDPNLVLIEVNVESAHFWNNNENKLLPLLEGGGVTNTM